MTTRAERTTLCRRRSWPVADSFEWLPAAADSCSPTHSSQMSADSRVVSAVPRCSTGHFAAAEKRPLRPWQPPTTTNCFPVSCRCCRGS